MACHLKLLDTGTFMSFSFMGDGDFIGGAGTASTLYIQEGTLSMPTPEKRQVFSGESPFRHGSDLVMSSYNNREITFSFSIRADTAETIPERIVQINQMLERARQYSLWPVRRGVVLQVQLKENAEVVTFDVIDGNINIPDTAFDKTNFTTFGNKVVLYNCEMRLLCKPFGRGEFVSLASDKTLYMNDEGLNFIHIYDASVGRWEHISGVVNYAGRDYFYPFPVNDTDGEGVNVAANGDAIYFGAYSKFSGLNFTIERTAAYTAATFNWEYWNGSSWAALTVTLDDDSTANNAWGVVGQFKSSGRHKITWSLAAITASWQTSSPSDGTTSLASAYYVRCRLSGLSSWTRNPRQEWDIVHRNRDNKLYIDADEIRGDAPAPAVIVIRSGRNKDSEPDNNAIDPTFPETLFQTTQVKICCLSRYKIERLRGMYDVTHFTDIYNPWGSRATSADSTASLDRYTRWGINNDNAGRLLRWQLSTSTGMARERWGNYAVTVRYRDLNYDDAGAPNFQMKARCYIYSDGTNYYGEESRWVTLPNVGGAVVKGNPAVDGDNNGIGARWNTVDIAQFPIPPAVIGLQVGYLVYIELWARKIGSLSPAYLDLDYMYLWPIDQSYLNMRTTYQGWHIETDSNFNHPTNHAKRTEWCLSDSETQHISLVNDANPIDVEADSYGVALAGFDQYQSGRFPWILPGHDFMLGVHTKNDQNNRFDAIDDTVSVSLYYQPRFLIVANVVDDD